MLDYVVIVLLIVFTVSSCSHATSLDLVIIDSITYVRRLYYL